MSKLVVLLSPNFSQSLSRICTINSTCLLNRQSCLQNGKFAVVGTYDGRCIFYSTDQLKYHTMINARSARGKNAEGRKVTGIEQMPGEDKVNTGLGLCQKIHFTQKIAT